MQAQRALVATGLGPRCTSEPAKVLPRARRLPSASVWLQVCPCDPHNGKKRRAAAVKPAGRASDAQLLALLRDARRPPRCCRGFLRVLLGAAAALGAGRPRWQLVCRSGRGNLRTAVGGLAPAASSGRRGSSLLGARGWGRAERPGRSAGREGDAERPRSAARRALPPDRPPPAGAALPWWGASRTCSSGPGSQQQPLPVQRHSRGRTWAARALSAVCPVPVVGVVAPAHSLPALGAPPPRCEHPPAGSPP